MTADAAPAPGSRTLRVATDVGGTYTDLVTFAVDETTGEPRIRTAKADTTPPDFEKGVLDVMQAAGVDAAAVAFLAHGTTVVINALTERTGAKVGLLATEGFPRHPRDRARQPARLLQPPLPEAAALRAPVPAPRAAGTGELSG